MKKGFFASQALANVHGSVTLGIPGRLNLWVLFIEKQHPMPHILRRGGAIAGPVIGEEGVAGVAIHLEFVGLAVPVQFFLETGGMSRRGVGILSPNRASNGRTG